MDLKSLARAIHKVSLEEGKWDGTHIAADLAKWEQHLIQAKMCYYAAEVLDKVNYEGKGPTPQGFPAHLAALILDILDFCEFFEINIEEALTETLGSRSFLKDKGTH